MNEQGHMKVEYDEPDGKFYNDAQKFVGRKIVAIHVDTFHDMTTRVRIQLDDESFIYWANGIGWEAGLSR